jgi:multiple sugar transport system substrate-binding protein
MSVLYLITIYKSVSHKILSLFKPFVLCLLLLMTLSCAAGSSSPSAQTVKFMVFGDPAERDAYQKLVEAFHEVHPDIGIELTHIPSPSDYRVRLATEFAAGSPPDIMLMNYRRFAAFAANELLEPLGVYLEQSQLIEESDFYPITIDSFRWDGVLTCIPQNISSLVVYYNQDLFDAAGLPYPADDWSWDDFVVTASTLTRDRDGQIDQYGLGVEPSLFRLAPFIWQNGGSVVDNSMRPTRLTLTRQPAKAALDWFVDLRMVHGVVPDRVAEAALDSESRFIAGQTAMFLNSRRGTPTYREIKHFVWDIAPLPKKILSAGILHSDGYCLSRRAANKEAAWTFIEFANSPDGQAIVATSGRTVPSLIKVAESEAFLDPTQPPSRSRIFLDTIESLHRVPIMSRWDEIEKVASQEVERAFYGDISVEEAIILMTQRTDEYFLQARSYEQ